jgi:quercetin dioxygenase-like cupin family protein
VIALRNGEELGQHSVRERAVLQVISGSVSITTGAQTVSAAAGTLVTFEPGERHSVRAESEARLLLLLAPWPAASHYSAGESAEPGRMPANATTPALD